MSMADSTEQPDGTTTEADGGVLEYGSELLRPERDEDQTEEESPSPTHIQAIHSASSQAGPSSGGVTQHPGESEDEVEELAGNHTTDPTNQSAAGPSSKKNKKKKSKGKASALAKNVKNSLASVSGGTTSSSVSLEKNLSAEGHQLVVDRIRAENGDEAANQVAALGPKELGRILDRIRILDAMQVKTGIGGKNKKDMADHKFWATQPVRRLDEQDANFEEGEIEPSKSGAQIRQTPLTLPDGYEWCTLDLGDQAQLRELYELLTMNYVEDDDAMFRFDYTAPFIEWALRPPGFIQDWHVAVRVASGKRRLIAFISGVPMNLQVRAARKNCSEINFLCIHKKLRSKRLAPVLIKEITRRCNIRGIFQAIYTAGVFLPTPISRCQYFHRNLNPTKLIATGFSAQPRGISIARLKRMYECPAIPQIAGFREIEEKDIPAVGTLLQAYMARFDLYPVMADEEVRHNFISGRGKGEMVNGRRSEQVTWSYVVENPETHLITDFISFYHLPSTAMKSTPHQTIDAAYLFYYATTSCPACQHLESLKTGEPDETSGVVAAPKQFNWQDETKEEREVLQKRLIALVGDGLTMAQTAGFDVFNALTLMDNALFVRELQFGAGDGFLHYYLYNWKVHQIRGGIPGEMKLEGQNDGNDQGEIGVGSGVGVVML